MIDFRAPGSTPAVIRKRAKTLSAPRTVTSLHAVVGGQDATSGTGYQGEKEAGETIFTAYKVVLWDELLKDGAAGGVSGGVSGGSPS